MEQRSRINRFGMVIKECCASCKHHEANTENTRLCMKNKGVVKLTDYCDDYEFQDVMKAKVTSLVEGKVKRPTYLHNLLHTYGHFHAVLMEEKTKEANLRGMRPVPPTTQEVLERCRADYEEKRGCSIYFNF